MKPEVVKADIDTIRLTIREAVAAESPEALKRFEQACDRDASPSRTGPTVVRGGADSIPRLADHAVPRARIGSIDRSSRANPRAWCRGSACSAVRAVRRAASAPAISWPRWSCRPPTRTRTAAFRPMRPPGPPSDSSGTRTREERVDRPGHVEGGIKPTYGPSGPPSRLRRARRPSGCAATATIGRAEPNGRGSAAMSAGAAVGAIADIRSARFMPGAPHQASGAVPPRPS